MSDEKAQTENYWDLLQETARLQARMGEDLVAWAQAYEAGGKAFQHSGETLGLMAELGQRVERYLETGPPATVQQTMRFFSAPWQAMAGTAGAGMGDPWSRFWDLWGSSLSRSGPPPAPDSGDKPGTG